MNLSPEFILLQNGYATEEATRPNMSSSSSALESANFEANEGVLNSSNSSLFGGVFRSRRRLLYPGGPWVSSVGFGSYRVGLHPAFGFPECQKSLEQALKNGLNLIDTSTNYGDGQSELFIGRTLMGLFQSKALKREEICVVSKIGYVQGQTMELARSRKQQNNDFVGMCELSNQVWHCMHPEFLRDQLVRSLERLSLSALDCLLLHNPEYFLRFAQMKDGMGLSLQEAHQKFEEVIFEAFVQLEKFVIEGKIKCYGISSNTLGYSAEDATATNIVFFNETAKKAAEFLGHKESHFKVVQCPLNWMETLPALSEIKGTKKSTLEYAASNGIGVLVNRPFNAMVNGGLVRLTRPFSTDENSLSEGEKKGYRNWMQLSKDLEFLAQKFVTEPGYEYATLQEFVLCTLMWMPGVSSVLCGLRQSRYVNDAISAAQRPALLDAYSKLYKIYENLEFQPNPQSQN